MVSSDSLHSQAPLNSSLISGITEPQPVLTGEGVDLEELATGTVLEVKTGHTTYRLEYLGDGNALISGHPQYCPQPVTVQIHGSTTASGMPRWHRIEKGMNLVFLPPNHGAIRTSRVEGIRVVNPEPRSN